MRYHRWHDAFRVMSRRGFIVRLGAAGAGGVGNAGGVAAAGGRGGGDGGGIVEPPPTGNITGLVESLDGTPQPGLGTLILMTERGRQTGKRTSPDANRRGG